MPYCTACGEEVQPEDEFCVACGADLSSEPEPGGTVIPEGSAAPVAEAAGSAPTRQTGTPSPQGGVSDVLSRGWSFLTDHPMAFAAFGVAGLLQLFGSLVGGGGAAVFDLVAGLTVALGGGVVILGVSRVRHGERFEFEPLVEETIGRLVPAIIAGIVWSVLVVLGLFLLVIPGIYLMVRFAFTAQAVFLEGRGPIEALRSSWAQTDGHLFAIFGVLAAIVLASIVVGLVPLIGRPVATLIVTPLGIAGLTHLYLDLQR